MEAFITAVTADFYDVSNEDLISARFGQRLSVREFRYRVRTGPGRIRLLRETRPVRLNCPIRYIQS